MRSIAAPASPIVSVHPTAICHAQYVGEETRIWAYAHIMDGATIGDHCNICDHVFIEGGVRIGNRVTIKNNALVWEGVTIEDDVFVGPGATFTNDRYPRSSGLAEVGDRYRDKANWLVPTLVQRGASIGAGAVIVCGVRIGQFACVGAGAVVIRDVPDYHLVVGNPARSIGFVCACGAKMPASKNCDRCQRSLPANVDPALAS